MSEKTTFSRLLILCVRDRVGRALGEAAIEAVLQYLGPNPCKMSTQELHSRLSLIFGSGAEILERMVIRELHRRLNISHDEEEAFCFEKLVERGRKVFQENSLLFEARLK